MCMYVFKYMCVYVYLFVIYFMYKSFNVFAQGQSALKSKNTILKLRYLHVCINRQICNRHVQAAKC